MKINEKVCQILVYTGATLSTIKPHSHRTTDPSE